MLVRREHGDDAVDRLGRVQRVERRENEVPRLGGRQGRPDRLGVAHFADEDHVGVLAQRAPERDGEALRVHVELALVDDRLLVAVQVLDRVLDRHDVLVAESVDVVHHRGERRRLARSRRAGAEHEASLLHADSLEDGGQEQLADRQDSRRNDPQHESHGAPLLEDAAAEPAEIRHLVGRVDLEIGLELLFLARRHDRERHRHGVFLDDAAHLGHGFQDTVDAENGEGADLQMEVRSPALDRHLQEIVDVHRISLRPSLPVGKRW